MTAHEILIGLHFHEDQPAGLEAACDCGVVIFTICDPEGLLQLSELNALARDHEEKHAE